MCLERKGEVEKRKVSIENIVDLLDIHRNSDANKLNGCSSFIFYEVIFIRNFFFRFQIQRPD